MFDRLCPLLYVRKWDFFLFSTSSFGTPPRGGGGIKKNDRWVVPRFTLGMVSKVEPWSVDSGSKQVTRDWRLASCCSKLNAGDWKLATRGSILSTVKCKLPAIANSIVSHDCKLRNCISNGMTIIHTSRKSCSRNSFRIRMYVFGMFQFRDCKPCRMRTSPAKPHAFFSSGLSQNSAWKVSSGIARRLTLNHPTSDFVPPTSVCAHLSQTWNQTYNMVV
jgi:hypothetical protein